MSPETQVAPNQISTLNEKSLHASLKEWYARPGDRLEESVDGFLIDVVRDGLLIEIQTRNFSALKRKLRTLTREHPVRLVYPIASEKWIVRVSKNWRKQLGRRKSPKHGSVENLFEELVSIPTLLAEANFSLEVLLIHEEEVSVGLLNESLVHPREVFNPAIRESAAAVIFVHNHPSGDPKPSRQDEQLTRRLHEAGKVTGISVLDHVIIGRDGYYSFAENGQLDREAPKKAVDTDSH